MFNRSELKSLISRMPPLFLSEVSDQPMWVAHEELVKRARGDSDRSLSLVWAKSHVIVRWLSVKPSVPVLAKRSVNTLQTAV
ncbi:hypothetical protein J6590_031679 [Homalodisca vitripennis]|nr:hypothetical protein J6590_031679 [Homalodisca vitripennis]